MYAIYALVDPRDHKVRYIGSTNDVYKRFHAHVNGSGGGQFAKTAWIMELRLLNKMVLMETLEEVETKEQAEIREAYWIKHFESLVDPFFNISKTASPRRARRRNHRVGNQILSSYADSDFEKVLPIVEVEEVIPTHVSDELKPFVLEPFTQPPRKTYSLEDVDFDAALVAWNAGYRSARSFARAMTMQKKPMGKDKALLVMREMKKRKII